LRTKGGDFRLREMMRKDLARRRKELEAYDVENGVTPEERARRDALAG